MPDLLQLPLKGKSVVVKRSRKVHLPRWVRLFEGRLHNRIPTTLLYGPPTALREEDDFEDWLTEQIAYDSVALVLQMNEEAKHPPPAPIADVSPEPVEDRVDAPDAPSRFVRLKTRFRNLLRRLTSRV